MVPSNRHHRRLKVSRRGPDCGEFNGADRPSHEEFEGAQGHALACPRRKSWATLACMAQIVTITGPIAAGKNTVAALVVETVVSKGRAVVVVDVDDVAAMVAEPGAAATGLWFAAHRAHGALVASWMMSDADVVVSVGPIFTEAESMPSSALWPPTLGRSASSSMPL